MSEHQAAIDRIHTIRALVDGQTKACAHTHDRAQFLTNWWILQGIDLALQAIASPQIVTSREVAAST